MDVFFKPQPLTFDWWLRFFAIKRSCPFCKSKFTAETTFDNHDGINMFDEKWCGKCKSAWDEIQL